MAAEAPRVSRPLLDRKGITAHGGGGKAEFRFVVQEPTWVLRANLPEETDPYGGHPIQFFPEVIGNHENKVLFRLRSPHRESPTNYYVYNFPVRHSRAGPSVDQLSHVQPEILSPQSVGLLRNKDGERYVVANLRPVLHPIIRFPCAWLDLWWYSPSSSSKNRQKWTEQHILLKEEQMPRGWADWRTDRVITFEDTLLWVDLMKGILHCTDLRFAKFHFVPLPSDLPVMSYGRRMASPEMFRSVGCCDGKLKLVNLSGSNTVEVAIWTLETSKPQDGKWTWNWIKENNISGSLDCTTIWADMKTKLHHTHALLPPWGKGNYLPRFPVLSTDKSDTLYVTVVRKNYSHAWLLQIDMQTKTLMDAADYPSFCSHMKPPYPIDLSKYTPRK